MALNIFLCKVYITVSMRYLIRRFLFIVTRVNDTFNMFNTRGTHLSMMKCLCKIYADIQGGYGQEVTFIVISCFSSAYDEGVFIVATSTTENCTPHMIL